jgi:hypothetical protein
MQLSGSLCEVGKEVTVLSPLSNDTHDKSSHVLHFADTLFLQFILFVQELIRDTLSLDESIQGFSGGRDFSVAQARDAASELRRLPGKSLSVFEACATREAGRE